MHPSQYPPNLGHTPLSTDETRITKIHAGTYFLQLKSSTGGSHFNVAQPNFISRTEFGESGLYQHTSTDLAFGWQFQKRLVIQNDQFLEDCETACVIYIGTG